MWVDVGCGGMLGLSFLGTCRMSGEYLVSGWFSRRLGDFRVPDVPGAARPSHHGGTPPDTVSICNWMGTGSRQALSSEVQGTER